MSDKLINLTLKLNDKVSKPLRNVQKQFDGFVNQKFGWSKQLGQSFKGISKSLSGIGETAGIGKVSGAFGELKGSMGDVVKQSLGLVAGGAAVVGGLFAIAKSTADAGDGLINVAKRLNFGIEAFQEYRFAAEQSGVSNEDFSKGLQTFTKKIGEAKAGQGGLFNFLKKSNPELLKQVLGAKSNEAAFDLMINSLGGVKDAQKQAAYAAMIFGKSGANFTNMANEGADGINKLRGEARSLGVMSESQAIAADNFGDSWNSVEKAFIGIKNSIGMALIPEFQKLADEFMSFFQANKPVLTDLIKKFSESLPGAIAGVKDALSKLWSAFQVVIDVFKVLGETFGYGNTIFALIAATVGSGLVLALGSAIGAFYALGVAIMTTPIGWIMAGIAGVIAAFVLLYKYWGEITTFLKDSWMGIGVALMAINPIFWLIVGALLWVWKNWDMIFSKIMEKVGSLKKLLPSWLGGSTTTDININKKITGKDAIQNFASTQTSKNESEIKVSFDNMPKGARVDSKGSSNVETEVRMGLIGTSTI